MLAALTLLGAACGGGDDDEDGGATGTGSGTTTETEVEELMAEVAMLDSPDAESMEKVLVEFVEMAAGRLEFVVGAAKAVAEAGAKAIATGSWSVAAAQGYPDGEAMPLDLALANIARIADTVDLPVTIDRPRRLVRPPGPSVPSAAVPGPFGPIAGWPSDRRSR